MIHDTVQFGIFVVCVKSFLFSFVNTVSSSVFIAHTCAVQRTTRIGFSWSVGTRTYTCTNVYKFWTCSYERSRTKMCIWTFVRTYTSDMAHAALYVACGAAYSAVGPLRLWCTILTCALWTYHMFEYLLANNALVFTCYG